MSKTLPIIPIRTGVLFPGVSLPITAGRAATLKAIDVALRDPNHLVLALAQRDNADEVLPEGLYTIGTIAKLGAVQRGTNGVRLVLEGVERAIALRVAPHEGYLQATVTTAVDSPADNPKDATYVALQLELRERSVELAKKRGVSEGAVEQLLGAITEPGQLADVIAGYLDTPTADRQAILEELVVEERLRSVLVMVQRQIAVLSAQEDIQSKVKEELGERQREHYLREQLKAIQSELGEGDAAGDASFDELKAKLAKLALNPEARKEVDRELARLARAGRESMEAQIIRTYLETVAALPWGTRTPDVEGGGLAPTHGPEVEGGGLAPTHGPEVEGGGLAPTHGTVTLDVAEAAKILDEDHHGLADVKDRVLEFLAVHQLSKSTAKKGRILLFSGPPGVGKTSIAKSIARAMGRNYVRIALGGARDEADIRGHRRTYIGALPGRILQGLKQAGSKNAVFLLDEVDKLGSSYQGDPASALLEVLDPAQNDSFTDHYLGVPFDLSEVMFIATANFLQNIPGPLLDRMEVVDFAGYTEAEKLAIATDYLAPRQLEENGLEKEQLTITDAALREVITAYTREAGVRQLERELGRLSRKVTRRIAAKEVEHVTIDREDVRSLLGRPRVHAEKASREDQIGISTGMYYTPAGGDIMFVEAAPMRGKGDLILTGQLGDVMKESARAAWTFARSHADWLGIDGRIFERDLHVHVPAGAIPKDGPSAGIAMATAIVSALSDRPARHDVAMTGEITLSGRVLPIGGLKEKVLGAVRAGITHIVIPKANEPDLDDLPKDVLAKLVVSPVETLAEALVITLRDTSLRDGRLYFGAPLAPTESQLAH